MTSLSPLDSSFYSSADDDDSVRRRFRFATDAGTGVLTLAIVAMAVAAAAGGAYLLVDVSHDLRDGTRHNADPVTRDAAVAPTIQSAYLLRTPGADDALVLFLTLDAPGTNLSFADALFRVDGPASTLDAPGDSLTWTAERDADASLLNGRLTRSDLAEVRMPLDGFRLEGADAFEVSIAVDGDVQNRVLVVPAAPASQGLVALDLRP